MDLVIYLGNSQREKLCWGKSGHGDENKRVTRSQQVAKGIGSAAWLGHSPRLRLPDDWAML